MFMWIQFGKGMVGCWHMRFFNRESPRILANRIFLAPSCSAPAYACKSKICVPPQMGFAHLGFASAESHAVWKNANGKTGVPVFLKMNNSFLTQRKGWIENDIFSNGDMKEYGFTYGKTWYPLS